MGLSDFWDAGNRANDFLRTGSTSNSRDLLRNPGDSFVVKDSNDSWVGGAPTGSGGTASCHSSTQCPSGYACVNGQCTPMSAGGQNQQNSAGQDCDPDDPNSPCNTGAPGACQQTANCGDTDGKDCCGTRCCSFGSASSSRPGVHCWCSDCPPWPTCSDFCEAYLKANGEPGPGCSEGVDGNSCDACNYCQSGQCRPTTFSPPCWCEGSECNAGNCEKCQKESDKADFGECVFDGSNCKQCATIRNHLCPCNRILPDITVCKAYVEGGLPPINLPQQEAARRCEEECAKPDPCEPKCSSVTRCTDTGTGVAACLEGETQTGTLQAGGETCVFCQKCNTEDLPESCKDCDCNCHDDCPDCQLCGADGTCQPDPKCGNGITVWKIDARDYEYTLLTCAQTGQGGINCANASAGPYILSNAGTQVSSPCAPLPHTLHFIGTDEQSYDCSTCSSSGTTSALWEVRDRNGDVILSAISGGGLVGASHVWTDGSPLDYPPQLIDTVIDSSCADITYRLEYRWAGYLNTAYPEYDCRNKNDDSWQPTSITGVTLADRARYGIGQETVPMATPPNYCSFCTYLTGDGCVAPSDCRYEFITHDGAPLGGGGGLARGQATGVGRSCPQGGGDNMFYNNRQLEIRWIPET